MTEAIAPRTVETTANPINWDAYGDEYGGGPWTFVTYRHGSDRGDQANVQHFDGHVSSYHRDELYPDPGQAESDASDAIWDAIEGGVIDPR